MKICFIYYSIFSLGGIQRCITDLSNYLVNNGYEIYVICTDSNIKIDRKMYGLSEKVKVILLKRPSLWDRFKKKIAKGISKFFKIFDKEKALAWIYSIYNKQISKIIEKEKINIVIGCSSFHSVAVALLKNKGIKKIGWQHNCYERLFNTKNKDFYNKSNIVNKMFRNLDKYVVLTNDDKEKLKKYKYDDKIIRIYNPVGIIQEQKSNLEQKKFLAIGRLCKAKGFDALINNFKEFNKYNKEWKLDIVGEGEERKKLEQLIKKLELKDYVRILHRTNDVKSLYKEASIYCMTSYVEGLPLVILEAMESGLPIIVYELPFVNEIFISKNQGIIIKNRDNGKYVKAMLELAKNKEKREKIAKNEIERIKDFNMRTIGMQWEDLFIKLQHL